MMKMFRRILGFIAILISFVLWFSLTRSYFGSASYTCFSYAILSQIFLFFQKEWSASVQEDLSIFRNVALTTGILFYFNLL